MKEVIKRVLLVLVIVFAYLSGYLEFFDILTLYILKEIQLTDSKTQLAEIKLIGKQIQLLIEKIELIGKQVQLSIERLQSDERLQLAEKEIEHLKNKLRIAHVFLFYTVVTLILIISERVFLAF